MDTRVPTNNAGILLGEENIRNFYPELTRTRHATWPNVRFEKLNLGVVWWLGRRGLATKGIAPPPSNDFFAAPTDGRGGCFGTGPVFTVRVALLNCGGGGSKEESEECALMLKDSADHISLTAQVSNVRFPMTKR